MEGLEEIRQALRRLPEELQKNELAKATRKVTTWRAISLDLYQPESAGHAVPLIDVFIASIALIVLPYG